MSGLKVKMMHQNLKTIFSWPDHSKHLRHAFLDNAYLKALAALEYPWHKRVYSLLLFEAINISFCLIWSI